jgi:uncharacterized protein (TIGR03437 family)
MEMNRFDPKFAQRLQRQGCIRLSIFFGILSMNRIFAPDLLIAQGNVLAANYDNERTNLNLNERLLKPSNVNVLAFGKIGSFPVDGQIYAQALYVAGVQIPGQGHRNVVYTVTMHNSVYAIDADAPGFIAPLWQVNLGPSVPSSLLNFTDILPEVGILSTPVIDLGRQAIYVVSDTLEGGLPVFRLHALSLADGHEICNGPAVVAASVTGNGAGSNNGTLSFDASLQLQRPGLALVNNTIYVAFGSHGDGGSYHGWMFGYGASDLQQRAAVFNTTPNALGGSFWQSGRAPVIDSSGNIYAVTGNGDFTGESEFSDSVLKLSASGLMLLDWYTPDNWMELRDNDEDLGSAGAILIPGSNQLLAAGKSGDLLLINSNSMGHLGPMSSSSVVSFRASQNGIFNFALWQRSTDAIVYVQEPWGPLKTFRIDAGNLDPQIQSASIPAAPTLFAGIAVSADNRTDGTGIVWQTTGDYGTRRIPGTLHAFDATDLSRELWNSDMVPNRDTLGRFAKFVAPTVINGRVYVPTFSNQLAIYGLLAADSSPNNGIQITSVANGASLLVGPVSPGEVVTIFGANIGPVQFSGLEVDAAGLAKTVLANTQVLFDGVPAVLLYTSSAEVGAVVPFGASSPTTQMQVIYGGQTSASIAVPVVAAAPAFFALDGTGGGPGAILNEDGSVNAYINPASRGSIITVYGTGLGTAIPFGNNSGLAGSLPSPPDLPVTVLIDGQPAEISYMGAAPGMVQGIVQINVRIPDTTTPVYDVRVTIKLGKYSSPSTVTLSVQ